MAGSAQVLLRHSDVASSAGQDQPLISRREGNLTSAFASIEFIVLNKNSLQGGSEMGRASSYMVVGACLLLAAVGSLRQAGSQAVSSSTASASLDYEFFKAKVEPVFL